MAASPLILGAVAYDPKVVTIWDGFRAWFAERDFDFDYVLFSNYERQVDAHLDGAIDVAWNSPLAWVRTRRAAHASGRAAHAVAMRDTDCDLTSVVVTRTDSGISGIRDLKGKTVGVGAVDSPQATLLPISYLRREGLTPGVDVTIRRFDALGGKHGDHIGGERDAARALMAGEVDAACMIDGNHLLFGREGTLPAGATTVIGQTPPYDHCNFTVIGDPHEPKIEQFVSLLLGMSYDDPAVRPLLDLEGLKEWRVGRVELYAPLERAVDEVQFYDTAGTVTAADYRP
jgi:ABC-type phosphate/phosphonate transport system substrate-binding protein